jgi:serine/threonine protein kinase
VTSIDARGTAAHAGRIPPDELMEYLEALAQVLHDAHKRGIVHRDLKPDNLMVVMRGAASSPK